MARTVRAVFLASLLSALASPALANNTDVVHTRDGNVLLGEVKRLDLSVLELSLDETVGRVRVKWEHVVRLVSTQQLEVVLTDGQRHFGPLVDSPVDGALRVRTAAGDVDVRLTEVVLIAPIEASFWARFNGSVAAGLSFTKTTDILQLNLDGSTVYRKQGAWTELGFNSLITSKSGDDSRTNSDARLTHARLFRDRWFYAGAVGASRNDELGMDLRASVSGGLGRVLFKSTGRRLWLATFLSGNRELTSDGRRTHNLELAFRTQLLAFRYDSPKVEVKSNMSAFVNLTSWGRYRLDFDARVSLETFKDLFWDVGQVYYRFDSDPSLTADSTADWGIVTGLRYTF